MVVPFIVNAGQVKPESKTYETLNSSSAPVGIVCAAALLVVPTTGDAFTATAPRHGVVMLRVSVGGGLADFEWRFQK
jgi:hypothetical protein